MLRATDCPVFEVKAKISMSVHSDVINRSIQKLEKDLTILQKKPLNTWISWINIQMLYFPLSREKVMVELGTAISVSVLFLTCVF